MSILAFLFHKKIHLRGIFQPVMHALISPWLTVHYTRARKIPPKKLSTMWIKVGNCGKFLHIFTLSKPFVGTDEEFIG